MNDPVNMVDPSGLLVVNWLDPLKDPDLSRVALSYQDSRNIHVFAHGNPYLIQNSSSGSTVNYRNANDFLNALRFSHPDASSLMNQNASIFLHSCRTATPRSDGRDPIAVDISKNYDGNVIASTERAWGATWSYQSVNQDQWGNVPSYPSTRSHIPGSWLNLSNGSTIDSSPVIIPNDWLNPSFPSFNVQPMIPFGSNINLLFGN